MGQSVATIIVEPRLLVREALMLLFGSHSYQVVRGVETAAEITSASFAGGEPKLVILGALAATDAVKAAGDLRGLWRETKILLLFEHASAADLQLIVASEIDGCVPLYVSPDTLIGTLDLIVLKNLRILVTGLIGNSATGRARSDGAADEPIPTWNAVLSHPAADVRISLARVPISHADPSSALGSLAAETVTDAAVHLDSHLRNGQGLSEREGQILKGLMKGHSNKVIARMCDVTEATIKVHMKSILRKIRVANRTQAAIWAFEHQYGHEFVHQTGNGVIGCERAP
jgi:two-component system, NarL family, nitrate/nitrite response regulator NarL